MSRHFDASNRAMLLNPERAEWTRPAELFAALEMAAGMKVADLGCGPGYFALQLAALVGDEGRVFVVDDSPEMLGTLADGARDLGLTSRIEPHQADLCETGLPDNGVDLALCIFVYHEIEDRDRLLTESARITRAGGTVAMVDWRKGGDPDLGPPDGERLTSAQMLDPMEHAGLAVEKLDFSPDFDVLIGRMPDEAGA
jgi:ubiquinone/menaquinone biosynthesis C-methylase UbiE